jgi:hypothetical protein
MVLLIVVIAMMLIPSMVLADSNDKGDFKTLCLGDDETTVNLKVDLLCNNGELQRDGDKIYTTILDYKTEMILAFDQEKLDKISLYFPQIKKKYFYTYLRSMLEEEIEPMLVKSYGEPINSYGYPQISEVDDNNFVYSFEWIIGKKRVIVGIAKEWGKDFYYAGIRINDNDKEIGVNNDF